MTDSQSTNGLPAEAQPWVRTIEKFMRDYQETQDRVANNSETALASSASAIRAVAQANQNHAQAQAEYQQVPATIDVSQVTITGSAYFDANGTPKGYFDVEIIPTDLDTEGNSLVAVTYQIWGRVFYQDPELDLDDLTTLGDGPAYQLFGSGPSADVTVFGLQCGVLYQLRAVAVAESGTPSSFSDYMTATPPATLEVMAAPSPPILSTGAGLIVGKWDGKLGIADPPSQFRSTYAMVSPAGAGTFIRQGSPLTRGGGTFQLAGFAVGSSYDVVYVAVDSFGAETAPSPVATITVLGIDRASLTPALISLVDASGNAITMTTVAPVDPGVTAGDIWFQRNADNDVIAQWMWDGTDWNTQGISHEVISSIDLGTATVGTLDGGLITGRTIAGDAIIAGTLTVNELSPTIGDDLDLAAKGSVNIIAGQVSDLSDALDGTNLSLATTQTRFSVQPDGVVISSPSLKSALALKSDQIQILSNGGVVSYWDSGQMHVDSFVGTTVQLGSHQITRRSATETVVRALS